MPKKTQVLQRETAELLPPGWSRAPRSWQTDLAAGQLQAANGLQVLLLESVERRHKGEKKSYSENRSVYQQGVIKVNEKNYLIRTTPDGGVCTRDAASLIWQCWASRAMPSIKVTSSAFLPA